ncbi:MAG: PRC-barrel domain-containing protein, partial [Clostridiales bacterium]|nr:PRC-barrel domain-containing protein [Clostridiales bacterium]
MIKISDYMGKSVVTLSEAVILGRVTDALYDKRLKRVRFLEVSPNDCGENKKRFLPIKRIRSVKDYISVMNLNGILFEDEADLNRAETIWNAKIVTTEGRSQGSLTDLEIIDSNGALERFMTDYGELSTDKIANVGKHLFIVYEDG